MALESPEEPVSSSVEVSPGRPSPAAGRHQGFPGGPWAGLLAGTGRCRGTAAHKAVAADATQVSGFTSLRLFLLKSQQNSS